MPSLVTEMGAQSNGQQRVAINFLYMHIYFRWDFSEGHLNLKDLELKLQVPGQQAETRWSYAVIQLPSGRKALTQKQQQAGQHPWQNHKHYIAFKYYSSPTFTPYHFIPFYWIKEYRQDLVTGMKSYTITTTLSKKLNEWFINKRYCGNTYNE